ncbi:hypothetical protein [Salinicola salarius]|uniref:hypothetical protein n=1 Tax=Salinicola salarius TaxID=430457 RepID=UPI003B8A5FA7
MFNCKTTAAEVDRQYGLTVSEIESWIDQVQRSMETAPKPVPRTSVSSMNQRSHRH